MAMYGGGKMWVPLEKKRPPSGASDDACEMATVLTLAPFSPTPRLSFGRVVVGTTKTLELIIRNPNDNARRVVVSKFPKGDAGFDWNLNYVTVPGHQEDIFEVSWTPRKEGNRRETLGFFVENNFCPQVFLIGEAIAKRIKKSKRCNTVLYPIENVEIQRCPIKSDGDVSKRMPLTSTLIAPRLTDHSTNSAAAATFTVSPQPIKFGDMVQLSRIDESTNFYGAPATPERRQTFLVHRKSNRENFDVFQSVRNGSDLPPCNVPLTPERRNTYVKSPKKERINGGSCSSISEDSLEERKPVLAFAGAVNDVADAAASVLLRSPLFKKPASPMPLCSTQLKDKSLPELKCDLTPVLFRKQLMFPRAYLAAIGQTPTHTFSVRSSMSAEINRPSADGQQTASKCRPLIELTMEQVDDGSSAWWFQKPDILNDWLSYALRSRGGFNDDEPKEIERWLQWGCGNFQKMRDAVIVIQTTVRMVVQRRKFQRLKSATIVIQRWYRLSTKTRHERKKFLQIRASVITIQTAFRRYRARKAYIRNYERVTMCQAVVRGFLQRRRVAMLKWAVTVVQRRFRARVEGRKVRNTILERRNAAIVIQSVFRRWIVEKIYVRNRNNVVKCQAIVRGFLQRRRFAKLKKAAIIIQRRFRAVAKGRVDRASYLRIRRAVITVQSSYRRLIARRTYLEDYQKVVKCQAVVRCHLQVQKFRRLRSDIVAIQTHTCALLMLRVLVIRNAAATTLAATVKGFLQQRRYARLRFAAIVIQRRWRARNAGIRQRTAFSEMKCAALALQTVWRGFRERRYFVQKRMAAMRIQSAVRCWIVRRTLEKRRRRVLHRAAVIIQNAWRAFAARKQVVKATVVIQRWFRSVKLVAKDRRSFLRQREACVRIQTFVRGWQARKRYSIERRTLAAVKIQKFYRACVMKRKREYEAAVKIQRWFRALRDRDFFVRLRSSSIKIQAAFRGHICRRELKRRRVVFEAMERVWERRLETDDGTDENVRECAAIVIQRMWRGYLIRKLVKPQELSLVRDNLARVNAAATEEQQLGNRTRNSLQYLLGCKLLSTVTREVINLEVTTSMSRVSCEQLTANNALDTLMQVIRNRNRSMPNIDILYHAIGVLINVAKCDSTVDALFATEHLLDTILHLANVYHEKAKSVFTRCVSLLWILGQDATRARGMKKHAKLTDKLRAIHESLHRKHDLAVQCLRRRHGITDQKFMPFHNLAALQVQLPPRTDCRAMPDWVIGRHANGQPRIAEFDNPIVAIDQLMRLLRVKPSQKADANV